MELKIYKVKVRNLIMIYILFIPSVLLVLGLFVLFVYGFFITHETRNLLLASFLGITFICGLWTLKFIQNLHYTYQFSNGLLVVKKGSREKSYRPQEITIINLNLKAMSIRDQDGKVYLILNDFEDQSELIQRIQNWVISKRLNS